MTRNRLIGLMLVFLTFLSWSAFSQQKNFLDLPFIETSANVDTLITPDRIYMNILIMEKDTKGRISVEELEAKLETTLKKIGVNTEKNLVLTDVGSNFKSYFLKTQDILKSKGYTVQVANAQEAGKVILALEEIGISNVTIDRTEFSRKEHVMLVLRTKAVRKAKLNAQYMTSELGQKVGAAIHISDFPADSRPMVADNAMLYSVRAYGYSEKQVKMADIEFQKLKFEVNVQVRFRLLD